MQQHVLQIMSPLYSISLKRTQNLMFCRFLKHFLLLVVINQMASALFRLIAAAGRNLIVANTFGAFALLILFALGGFVLSRGKNIDCSEILLSF